MKLMNDFAMLENYSSNKIKKIRLSQGWEEVDLSVHLDLDVEFVDGSKEQISFFSLTLIEKYINKDGSYLVSSNSYILKAISPKLIIKILER